MRKFINGYDLEAIFGTIITNGAGPLFQLPTTKAFQIVNDFLDEDGLDQDTSNPVYEARTFTFNCTTEADTIESFKAKYFGLFNLIKRGNGYTYFDEFLNFTAVLQYQSQTGISNMYRTSKGGYGLTYQLIFGETNPFDNIPVVLLVDDLGNVLVP